MKKRTTLVLCLAVSMLAVAQPGRAIGPEYAFKRGTLGGSRDRILAATATDIFMGNPGKATDRGSIDRYTRVGSGPTQTWDPAGSVTAATAGTGLGSSIAVEGDLLVVGAPELQRAYFNAPGAVFVYRIGTTLQKLAELGPMNGLGGQGFGAAVAIAGGTIVVGSPDRRDDEDKVVGAVYVFEPTGGDVANGWSQTAQIANPSPPVGQAGDSFGFDVGIGAGRIVVGAPQAVGSAALPAGAISVFARSGTQYTQIQRIQGAAPGDRLGSAIDVEGGRLLFGVPGRERAEIHRLDTGTGKFVPWTVLTPLSVTEGFGYSVDLLGNKALVGAPSTNRGDQDTGDAYGYRLRGSTWQTYFWPSAGLDAYDRAGRSVAFAGDRTVLMSWGEDRDNMAYGVMGYMDPDFTAPKVILDPPPPTVTRQSSVNVAFTVSDTVTPSSALIVECSQNSGPWTTCASPKTFSSLPELRNKLSVRARDEAGNVGAATAPVHVDQTRPRIVGERDSLPNEYGWNDSAVTVTWVCRDPASSVTGYQGSGILRCNSPTTVTSEGAGTAVLGLAADHAGNEATERFAPINIDMTPPVIRQLKPSANAYGWYRQNVWVSYECADTLSGVLRCPSGELIGEGITTVQNTAMDKAGNERTISAKYYVDVTRPVATLTTASPRANAAGWNSTPVTLSWTCVDALSGALSATNSLTVTDTWVNDPPVAMTCDDRAFNRQRIGQRVLIDDDKPVVGMNTPAPLLDGRVGGTMSDTESGIARVEVVAVAHALGTSAVLPARCTTTCERWVASTESLPRGVYTIYAVALDNAGNVAQSAQHLVFQIG